MSSAPPNSSKQLPRLLFLHGGGTNANIFYLQCRSLRAALGSHFRIVFANAPFVVQTPGPDVLSVFAAYTPFRQWLRIRHTDQPLSENEAIRHIDSAVEHAIREDDALGATGQWVGLVGFSQGCKIAASLLAREQIRQHRQHANLVPHLEGNESESRPAHSQSTAGSSVPHWRFAILFAGRGPLIDLAHSPSKEDACRLGLVPANEAGNPFAHMRPEQPRKNGAEGLHGSKTRHAEATTRKYLSLPTLHVHGVKDPGLRFHQLMQEEYCPGARVIEWDGDHSMPISTTDVGKVVEGIMELADETRSLAQGKLR